MDYTNLVGGNIISFKVNVDLFLIAKGIMSGELVSDKY